MAQPRSFAWSWIALLVIAPAIADVDSQPPLDLRGAKRGSCAEGQLEVGDRCLVPAKIQKKVAPDFPWEARREHLEGTVTLRVVVERDGTIGDVSVVSTTRHNAGFEEAAIAAVRQWRYEPARIGDDPVRVAIEVKQWFYYK